MSKWSSAVQDNAIEIHSRFGIGQTFKTIAKELKLADQEAKELELTLRYNPNPLLDNKSDEKLRSELNVSAENVAVWRAEFNALLFKQVWCKTHGDCSAEVTVVLDQIAAGRTSTKVSEFTYSLLPLLRQEELSIERRIHGELLPDNAFADLTNSIKNYVEAKNASQVDSEKHVRCLENGFCYRDYKLQVNFNKPRLELRLAPDINFESFLEARSNLKSKSPIVRWQGGLFDLGTKTSEAMAKWLVDQFVQNVNDAIKLEQSMAKRQSADSTLTLEDLTRDLSGVDRSALELSASKPRFQKQLQMLKDLLGADGSVYNGFTGVSVFAVNNLAKVSAHCGKGAEFIEKSPVEELKDRANEVLEALQTELREAGFLLLKTANVPDQRAQLVLLPINDKYMAIRVCNTTGGEHNNDAIIEWLQKLETKHPFFITGCGHDFIEGRFITPITDSKELARLIYEFCPDVVDQGTKTVAALARELEMQRRLFLWWD